MNITQKTALIFMLLLIFESCSNNRPLTLPNNYLVVAHKNIDTDSSWSKVTATLKEKHNAPIVYYENSPREIVPNIKELNPRYVVFVDKPENIGRDYIMDLHRMSRTIDDDIYADYLWGVITGYDADAALKMVNNSTEPLTPKKGVATIMEMNSGKWFDEFAFVDDHTKGLWGEKKIFKDTTSKLMIAPSEVLKKFYDIYSEYDPDLVVTAAHATERNLEMPFSLGNIKAKDGKLYADFKDDPQFLKESNKRRVYFAVGNCLIGNVNNTNQSMAIAWMNSANAATMIGYVVTTWHGRNGWGGLKYWLTNPGRYTLAEAIYLNQQDFLYQQSQWSPNFLSIEYPFTDEKISFGNVLQNARNLLKEKAGIEEPTIDQIGFLHDRDVLAYYGDPKWEVRMQEVPKETDFKVDCKITGNKCEVTITTDADFSLERMVGDKFKEEHVLDIPFSYFFPERLVNPSLADGQTWDAIIDENFLLIYNPNFEPNSSYVIHINMDIN